MRYVRADGKIHTVNLQNPALAEGRTQSIILRVGGLRRSHLFLELYVNCRLADSVQGLPQLAGLPEEMESMEFRNGQKLYTRLQVTIRIDMCKITWLTSRMLVILSKMFFDNILYIK